MRTTAFIITLFSIFMVAQTQAHCCDSCTAPNVKMYSIDTVHDHCGVSCMNPKYYNIYKIFEKGLEFAKSDTPCRDRNYTEYLQTVTHGVWPVTATLDMYNPNSDGNVDNRCCESCSDGKNKYFSVDKVHGKCGESCIKDSYFWLYRIFEKGLTKASSNTPCADLKFTKYDETQTHGFGPIKATVDLYNPETPSVDFEIPAQRLFQN